MHQAYPPGAVGGYGMPPHIYATQPPPAQHQPQSQSIDSEPVVELQWVPHTTDAPIVYQWFSDLDKEGKGIVGGLQIATFLKKSNLPKETLRTIWSLIDNKSLGYVNKSQFNNIIRLVSISCSPIYMGSPPSLERLQKTLYDKIPLPAALLAATAEEAAAKTASESLSAAAAQPVVASPTLAPVPALTATTNTTAHAPSPARHPAQRHTQQPYSGYPVPPGMQQPPSTALQATSVDDDDDEFSDFASAAPSEAGSSITMSTMGGPSRLDILLESVANSSDGPQWEPTEKDAELIDKWFTELDTENKGVVGGMAIAMFLKRSNLSKDILRTIWSLVDTKSAGHIDKDQFVITIRLVSISCSPIYMGTQPCMDRFIKTIKDSISLPFALTNTSMMESSVAPHTVAAAASMRPQESQAQAQEMGELSSAHGDGDTVSLGRVSSFGMSLSTAPGNTSSHRLSVFDDLVENDLKAMDEEWDDFADGNQQVSHATDASASIPPENDVDKASAVDHASTTSLFDSSDNSNTLTSNPVVPQEQDDIFGSFDGVDVQPAAVTSSAVESVASADPFGSFDNSREASTSSKPEAPIVSVVTDEEEDFGSFDEADHTTAPVTINIGDDALASPSEKIEATVENPVSTASAQFSDPFSSLDQADDSCSPTLPSGASGDDHISAAEQPITTSGDSAGTTTAVATIESTTVANAETAPVAVTADVAPASISNLDPFGSLDQIEDVPLPSLHVADDVDPFGSFDQGDASAVEPAVEISEPIVAPDVPVLEASSSVAAPDMFDEDGDDFGDFGDFETHTPVPAGSMAHPTSTGSMFDLADTPQISQSISELSLFDPPPEHSEMFMQDAFDTSEKSSTRAMTTATSAPALDLLDFLSDPEPSAQPASSFPISFPSENTFENVGIAQPFEANFEASFDDANQGASVGKDYFTSTSSGLKQSDICDTAPTSSSTATPSPVPIPSNLSTRKKLSYQTLETITATLIKKCQFEHAYNCNEQTKIARSIKELTDRKVQAVEEDDLETAMMLKKDINLLQLKIQGVDQEAIWEEEAASNRRGDSLQETADLLGAVDDVMANKFKKRFLGSVPPSTAPLDTQLSFQITARRYARMILSTCSTHSEYPRQWLLVLQIAVAKVKEGNDIITQFRQLSAADQTVLISHLKMSEYALGLVAISEIGLWVSASCIEAMVHEKIALEVFSVCQDLLVEVDMLWGMGSRFKAMSLETLTLEAAKLAENKRVQCCNFTLRPMSYEVYKPEGDKWKTDKVKLYDNPVKIADAHFMEPVIKLWLHDISQSMPNTAASAF